MVRLTIPMVLGIFMASRVQIPLTWAIGIFSIVTVVSCYFLFRTFEYQERWARGALVAIWMLVFGIAWMTMRDRTTVPQSIHHQIGNQGPWLVRIVTLNRLTDTQMRADADVLGYYVEDGWRPATGTIMLTTLRNEGHIQPRVGDRMLIEAPMKRILRVPDPGGFDRQVWAAARGIELELFATWDQWHRIDHTTTWIDHFSSLRKGLSAWVDEADLGIRERALVKALVLGQRDELDSEQRTHFARSGTIHVLAVSGMHVGLIYVILGSMFVWLGGRRWARIVRGLFVLLALWVYAGITGGAPSILRATVMFSLITLADMTARRTETINSLFAAMLLLLLWDPRMLGIIGFQLSFLAVLGIILFFKPIEDLWTPRTWIMRKIWSLAVISIAAQSLTTPASLYYFKAFPVWFLPANLIVVTVVIFSVWSSIALIVLQKVPILGEVITWVLTMLLKVVTTVTGFFAELPHAYPVLRVDPLMVVLLYVMILALAAWWIWRWRSMRWVFATSMAVFFCSWGMNARQVNRSNVFTLYDERQGILASMTHGREHVVLADPDRLANDPYAIRKIEQHQQAHGHRSLELLPPDKLISDKVDLVGRSMAAGLRWRNDVFDVLFVDPETQEIPIGAGVRFDAVVIYDMEHIPEDVLANAAEVAERIVIAGKTHWRSREKAFAWCMERGINVHDVFAQGAFVLQH